MTELLVMRHAKSDWSIGASDFDRPLNRRGERAAARMAEWVLDEQRCPDRVLTSPANRARTTAAAVAEACGVGGDDFETDPDLYLAGAYTWLQKLSARTESRLLICGHNPGLDDLVDHLSRGEAPITPSGKLMTTATIARFHLGDGWRGIGLSPAVADLVELVRPADLD